MTNSFFTIAETGLFDSRLASCLGANVDLVCRSASDPGGGLGDLGVWLSRKARGPEGILDKVLGSLVPSMSGWVTSVFILIGLRSLVDWNWVRPGLCPDSTLALIGARECEGEAFDSSGGALSSTLTDSSRCRDRGLGYSATLLEGPAWDSVFWRVSSTLPSAWVCVPTQLRESRSPRGGVRLRERARDLERPLGRFNGGGERLTLSLYGERSVKYNLFYNSAERDNVLPRYLGSGIMYDCCLLLSSYGSRICLSRSSGW